MTVKSSRAEAMQASFSKNGRTIQYPKCDSTSKQKPMAEVFGENVFTFQKMQKVLPKPLFAELKRLIAEHTPLTKEVADAVAHAVRIWAMDRGATHFTHWFQPQTDSTAEKHDAFLTLKYSSTSWGIEVEPFDAFSGSQLIQAEPDASSFPHGGMRTTFEARGYTIWDTSSPMYIKETAHGTSVLYIPSVFLSYNGEALDEKTILLRSSAFLSEAACKLLNTIGEQTSHIAVTLGTEQEFFLVDRGLYAMRPDLRLSGRSLIGSQPAKHQQLEDHYFGRIPSKVLAAISECELELTKLGVPIKTRHNEVAPGQFEMAPIFEEASIAVDHNLITMDVISRVSHRYGLKALFHEKPFKGVNGSGKHCNWSMTTDSGKNLLEPTAHPEDNYSFLLFLVGILHGVYKYNGLLRAGIASASNDHRLGAAEAPPAIISAFLGAHLSEVLDSIEEGRPVNKPQTPDVTSVKVGGTKIDVKLHSLPEIARDLTDRNRTSPFAFTGNKFEFRAVGSKQSPSFPVALLNSVTAAGILEVTKALQDKMGGKAVASREDIMSVLREYIKLSKNIRFEGDNYTEEWAIEAKKRNLENIAKAPFAFDQLIDKKNKMLLTKIAGTFSDSELHSRFHVLNEKYVKDVLIEANCLKNMMNTMILPAAFKYRQRLAACAQSVGSFGITKIPELAVIETVGYIACEIQNELMALEKSMEDIHNADESEASKKAITTIPIMEKIRMQADMLEQIVDNEEWPIPKYEELLFA